jgi:hypothetical protein
LDKSAGDAGDFIDRGLERGFVGLRRLVKTADFPYELERSRTNFVGCDRWVEVEKRFDISAHFL